MKNLYSNLVKSTLAVIFCTLAVFSKAQSPVTFNVDISPDVDYRMIKTIPLSDGKIVVLVATQNNVNIYFQVFDGATRLINVDITSYIDPWPNTDHSSIEFNATATTSNNVFITYNSNDSGEGIVYDAMNYLVFSPTGVFLMKGQVNSTDPGSVQTRFARFTNLSSGKTLVLFSRSDNNSYAFRIFNNDGMPFTADNVFLTDATFGGSVYTTLVAANRNGRFLISTYYYEGNLKGFLFNDDGTAVMVDGSTSFDLDNTNTSEYSNRNITALKNGNFILFWGINNGGYFYKIIDASGNDVKSKTNYPEGLNMGDAFAENRTGIEGYYVSLYVPQDATPGQYTNPYYKVVLKKFDQSAVPQGTAELEGYLIAPTYYFITSASGGYAYTYQYYRNYAVNTDDPGYEYNYPVGDGDIVGKSTLTALPVKLISFTANASGHEVIVKWQTATEQNSSYFIVQYSSDGLHWNNIGRVAASGNSQAQRNYQFIHTQPGDASNYYRLIQVDIDNKQIITPVALVRFDKQILFKMYPNPAIDDVTIQLPDQSNSRVKIYNMSGQVILSKEYNTNLIHLKLKGMVPGVYRVSLKQGTNTYSDKLIVH